MSVTVYLLSCEIQTFHRLYSETNWKLFCSTSRNWFSASRAPFRSWVVTCKLALGLYKNVINNNNNNLFCEKLQQSTYIDTLLGLGRCHSLELNEFPDACVIKVVYMTCGHIHSIFPITLGSLIWRYHWTRLVEKCNSLKWCVSLLRCCWNTMFLHYPLVIILITLYIQRFWSHSTYLRYTDLFIIIIYYCLAIWQ